jgi:hypothetical protein
MRGWERYGSHAYWRRVLSDDSYLSVMCENGGDPSAPLPWVWRHRGPGYDREVLGTRIHQTGRASSRVDACEAADRYAAGLTNLSHQPALFGGASCP